MEFITTSNHIYASDEAGNTIAEITFPLKYKGVVDIDHTFVDDSLRGQGVAGQLVEAAAQYLRANRLKAVVTCPYAKKWFEKHPEYEDILADH